jgi:hypothetical protein
MGFKADEAVLKLEWDFKPYVDAAGVSPEPSGTSLFVFQRNWYNTIEAMRRTAVARAAKQDEKIRGLTPDRVKEEVGKWGQMSWDEAIEESAQLMSGALGDDVGEELHRRLSGLVAELTENSPSQEQIMELPGRVRAAYLGWFIGQVGDPESGAVATRN